MASNSDLAAPPLDAEAPRRPGESIDATGDAAHVLTRLLPQPFDGRTTPPRMFKSWRKANGAWTSTDAEHPFFWRVERKQVGDLATMFHALTSISRAGGIVVIGERNGVADATTATRNDEIIHARPGHTAKNCHTFDAVPRAYAIFDLDESDIAERDPAKAAAIVRSRMGEPFREVACVWNATAGHGFKDTARLRLVFMFDRPLYPAAAFAFASETGVKFDRSIVTASQPIYVMPPRITGGPDPVKTRWGMLAGTPAVIVPDRVVNAPPAKPERLHAPADAAMDTPEAIRAFISATISRRPDAQGNFNRRNSLDKIAWEAARYAISEALALDLARAYVYAVTEDSKAARWRAALAMRRAGVSTADTRHLLERLVKRGAELVAHWAGLDEVLGSKDGFGLDPFAERFAVAYDRHSGEAGSKAAKLTSGEEFGAAEGEDVDEAKSPKAKPLAIADAGRAVLDALDFGDDDATVRALIALDEAASAVGLTEIATAALDAASALDGISPDDERDRAVAALRAVICRQIRPTADKAAKIAGAFAHLGGDMVHGRRFAERYGERFKFLSESQTWIVWRDSRWREQGARDAATGAAKELAATMLDEAARALGDDERSKAKLANAVAFFKSAVKWDLCLRAAQSEASIAASVADFDRNSYELCVRNGVLDLISGRLTPASPSQRHLRQAGCAFDADATAPMFEAFLNRVLPDPIIRAYVQRAVGYTLTGEIGEEKMHLLFGGGANGKSTLLNILRELLGEYACTLPASTLLRKGGESSEVIRGVTSLPGARLAICSELPVGAVWDDQIFKLLCGREPISARRLYREPFTFAPSHKLWLGTNNLPGAQDAGDGMWRRFAPVEFGVQIPAAERDPTLDRKIIAAELPGILNWALAGVRAWRSRGLDAPHAVTAHVESYREETDLIGLWLHTRTRKADAFAWTQGKAAYADFVAFAHEQGLRSPPIARAFGVDLRKRGFAASRAADGARYHGFVLRGPDREDGTAFDAPEADSGGA